VGFEEGNLNGTKPNPMLNQVYIFQSSMEICSQSKMNLKNVYGMGDKTLKPF
jgi:hypothetical protein